MQLSSALHDIQIVESTVTAATSLLDQSVAFPFVIRPPCPTQPLVAGEWRGKGQGSAAIANNTTHAR